MTSFYAVVSIFLAVGAYYFIDIPVATFVSSLPQYLFFPSILISLIATPFAHLFLWGGLSVLGWRRKWERQFTYRALQLCFICGFILFVCGVLKISLSRARPDLFFQDSIYGFYFWQNGNAFRSFPSSHTAIAFALAWFWRILSPKKILYPYLIASMVGLSRVLTHQHYISDILIGAWIGIFVSIGIYSLTEKYKPFIVKAL
jgi:membrane-associated phospholipid phosphatase